MSIDTISDMLTRIRNASLARHQTVQIPSTNATRNLAKVFLEERFIKSVKELNNGSKNSLLLSLGYTKKHQIPYITNISRASRPGLRIYTGVKKMPWVRGGFGIAIISTSKGLLTDKKARKERIGGELLCYIW